MTVPPATSNWPGPEMTPERVPPPEKTSLPPISSTGPDRVAAPVSVAVEFCCFLRVPAPVGMRAKVASSGRLRTRVPSRVAPPEAVPAAGVVPSPRMMLPAEIVRPLIELTPVFARVRVPVPDLSIGVVRLRRPEPLKTKDLEEFTVMPPGARVPTRLTSVPAAESSKVTVSDPEEVWR